MGKACSKHQNAAQPLQPSPAPSPREESIGRDLQLTIETDVAEAEFLPEGVRDLDHESSVCASPIVNSPGRRRKRQNYKEWEELQKVLSSGATPPMVLKRLLNMLEDGVVDGNPAKGDTVEELETLRTQYLQFVQVGQMHAAYADLAHKLAEDIRSSSIAPVVPSPTDNATLPVTNNWYADCNDEEQQGRLATAAAELEKVVAVCASASGCEPLLVDIIKRKEAIDAKATRKYGGDPSRVLDMVRGSIICDTLDQMDTAIKQICNPDSGVHVVRWKASILDKQPPPHSYRDIKLNILLPQSQVVAEIQLHLRSFYSLFEGKGYDLYHWSLRFEKAGLSCPRDYVTVLAAAQKYSRLNFLWQQQVLTMQELVGESCDDPEACISELSLLSHALAGVDNLGRALAVRMVQIMLIEQRFGETSMRLESSLYEAALLLVQLQRIEEAEKLLRRKLAIVELVCGEYDPVFPASLNSLGLVLRYQGRWADAAKCYTQAIDAESAARPNTNRAFQWSRNLAAMLQAQGEFAQAESHLQHSLGALQSLHEPWVGAEVVCCQEMLGMCLFRQGFLEKAEGAWRDALEWREANIPLEDAGEADRMAIAQLHYRVGVALLEQGQLDDAYARLQQALDVAEGITPSDISELHCWLHTLAALCLQRQQPADAERHLRRSLSLTERVCGPDHPLIVDDLRELAKCCEELGKAEQAKEFYLRAVKKHVAAFGEHDAQLEPLLLAFSAFLRRNHKYGTAIETVVQAIEVVQHNHGFRSPALIPLFVELAALLRIKHKTQNEESVLKRLVEIARSTETTDSIILMRASGRLAHFQRVKKLHHEAMQLYEEALSCAPEPAKFEEADRWLYNDCLTMITLYRVRFGDLDTAEDLCKQLLGFRELMYGKEHPNYAEALSMYASILKGLDRWDEAEEALRECKEIKQQVFGDDHFSLAETCLSLARIQHNVDKLAEAEFNVLQAVGVFERWEGYELQLCRALDQQALIFLQLGAAEKAKQSAERLVEMLPKLKLVDLTKEDLKKWVRTCWKALGCTSFPELPTELHRLLQICGVNVELTELDVDKRHQVASPSKRIVFDADRVRRDSVFRERIELM